MTTSSTVASSGPALVGNNAPQGLVVVDFEWGATTDDPIFTITHRVPAKPKAIWVFDAQGREVSIPEVAITERIAVRSTSGNTAGPGGVPGGTIVFEAFVDTGDTEVGAYKAFIMFEPDEANQVALDATFSGTGASGTITSTGVVLRAGNDLRGEVWGTITLANNQAGTLTHALGARPVAVEMWNASGCKLRTTAAAAGASTGSTGIAVTSTNTTVVFTPAATNAAGTFTFCIRFKFNTEDQVILPGMAVAFT